MSNLDGQGLGVQPENLALDGGAVPDEADGGTELPDSRDRTLDDDPGPVIAPHRVHRDLHDGGVGPRLRPFDGDDLPALVVPAVRADPVGQLRLATLRAYRARGRSELVVGATLAAARLRMSSFRQRHAISPSAG